MTDSKTTQILRLTYAEMFFVGVFLDLVVEEAPAKARETIRMQLGKSARKKIWDALEQAERDELVDMKLLEKQIGERREAKEET